MLLLLCQDNTSCCSVHSRLCLHHYQKFSMKWSCEYFDWPPLSPPKLPKTPNKPQNIHPAMHWRLLACLNARIMRFRNQKSIIVAVGIFFGNIWVEQIFDGSTCSVESYGEFLRETGRVGAYPTGVKFLTTTHTNWNETNAAPWWHRSIKAATKVKTMNKDGNNDMSFALNGWPWRKKSSVTYS